MSNYVCSDIHGIYNIWEQIKEFLQPTDILYCLGDCGDRGPDGWEIITEMYNHPRVIYLKGNHEDMLANAMLGDKGDCFYNGGRRTYEVWKYKYGKDMSWYGKLKHLPTNMSHFSDGKEIILCHSGFDIGERFIYGDEYYWNREHLYTEDWLGEENQFMIHGHTNAPKMIRYRNWVGDFPKDYDYSDPEIVKYCGGHKINIDLATAFTGKCALLNLDTFEVKYFYDEKLYAKYLDELEKYGEKEYWGVEKYYEKKER